MGGRASSERVAMVDSAASAIAVASKICTVLDGPFAVAGAQVRIAPSIGIAQFPPHGEDEKQLLRRADEAMYRAKRNGGNRFELWSNAADASTA